MQPPESQKLPQAPLLSIVIPTCRRGELLMRCLEALRPGVQTCSSEAYELIVSDDAQDAQLKAYLAEHMPWVHTLAGPGKGPAANRNHGAKAAQGEWIVFIDDDCIPSPSCLETYRSAALDNTGIDILEGAIVSDRPRRSLAEEAPLNLKGGVFWSCNVGVKKRLFQKLGGFDEDFPYAAYEDMDFAKRLKANGSRAIFLEEASVCHPWRLTTPWRKFIRQRKSALIYMKKHPEEWNTMGPWMIFKIAVGRFLFQTMPGLIRYKGQGFLSELAYDCLDLGFVVYLAFKGRPR